MSTPVNWLLVLPRELRDLIYEYTLTEDGGLILDCFTEPSNLARPRPANGDSFHEACHLALVCRQLRHETSGLSLHYNDLTFVHTRSWINVNTMTSAYQHLTTFAESCSPKHLKHIKRITLLDSSTDSLHERTISYLLTRKIWLTSSVGAFARNFPQTTVIVRLHLDSSQILSQRPIAFMDYQYQARHGSSPLLKAATTTNAQHVLRFQPLFDFERLANLRFSSTFKFDEEKAEEELRKKGTLTEDEISGTISMAKEMHENGI